jgi:predicted nuclease with TOPRIM domain
MAKEIDTVLVKTLELAIDYNNLKAKHDAILERVESLVSEKYALKDTIAELKHEIADLKTELANSSLEKSEMLKIIIDKNK